MAARVGVVELRSSRHEPMGTGEARLWRDSVGREELHASILILDEDLVDHGLPKHWQLFIRPQHLPQLGRLDGLDGSLKNKYGTAVGVTHHFPESATEFHLRIRLYTWP